MSDAERQVALSNEPREKLVGVLLGVAPQDDILGQVDSGGANERGHDV